MANSSSRTASLAIASCFLLTLAGCSSAATDSDAGNVEATESGLRLSGARYIGRIADGETKRTSYSDPPSYRAYGFTATGGDEVTVDISSDGDAMGWITDTRYTSLAANDDASSSTLDSHITYRVPDGVASRAYRIVFRSYDRADASFAVRLSIRAGEHAACEYAGNTYEYGERFPSTDGCNTCSCRTGGVTCTEKACACDPDHEPNRNYLGTPTSCQSIRYRCPSGTRSFQNACGCGCELL